MVQVCSSVLNRSHALMRRKVAVLLYPGCIFFEVALATELLAKSFDVLFFTPDGKQHLASNGSVLQAFGSYADLESLEVACVLIRRRPILHVTTLGIRQFCSCCCQESGCSPVPLTQQFARTTNHGHLHKT